MIFNYFEKNQAEQYSFIRIPKALMTDSIFSELSVEAKLLYGFLLDLMSYSVKNRWIDDKNRVFVVYPISHIQDDLCICKGKAVECLKELEEIGLIERKHTGQGKPSYIYVKNFIVKATAN